MVNFCHVQREVNHYGVVNVLNLYQEIFDFVISSCAKKISGTANVLHVDARFIPEMETKFDLVINLYTLSK